MADLKSFVGPNAGYVLDLYERYLRDPASVDGGWQDFFRSFTPPAEGAAAPAEGAPAAGGYDPDTIVAAHELAEAIRARGHTAARLSPIAPPADPDPALRPEAHGISEAQLGSLPAAVVRGPAAQGARDAAEGIARLRELYSGTIGYEFDHIQDPAERDWLRERVESGSLRAPLDPEERRALLRRLSQVEGFERFLHKAFVGQKRFSVEGTDALVPILDRVIGDAAAGGASDVVIGMAHRGRLNVLTHVLGKPYELMVGAFMGKKPAPAGVDDLSQDVKYHLGWRDSKRVGEREVTVTLAPNPSHLEFVDPVVVGMTRAAQDWTRRAGPPDLSLDDGVAVLVHGDAAFPGQGVVAETLNMSGLRGYTVGGTIHLIANNQIGFTTLPEDDRSTRYASDLAKGFEVPIVHVNADDPEACVHVARLAVAYRARYHKDFVVDLVGYRRWGHNEGDEPAFTQPRMYDAVRPHPTAREVYAERLAGEGVLPRDEADAMLQEVLDHLAGVQAALGDGSSMPAQNGDEHHANGGPPGSSLETAVPAERLAEYNDALLRWPEGFAPNARLEKQLARRRDALGPEGGIDWGHAETLAFASLIAEGVPVRLTGQDAERGTFSHRHLVLHDAGTGARHTPLAALPQARASFEVHNSPLSEMAAVGFEYGYSVFDPDVLVIWEAQFGDFVNGAQVMIDQFLSASYQKWEQTSGLVLLLPHGYEGQGPEHSSARLERFLQLSAEENFRVVNCTTSAQYFHLLRRQAQLLDRDPRPLIVMSPKSLLRHPLAASRLEQLAGGHFQCVIGDADAAERADEVTRLALCSGKVFADLYSSPLRAEARAVALARVEELYPFPVEEIASLARSFPRLREVVWVQEEPRNMGAWTFVEPRLREMFGDLPVRYEGRPERASPAEGSPDRHAKEQARIVAAAWGDAPAAGESPAERRARGDALIGKRK
ncbi:MAG TPA: 2-oxoglutarate dehydrogenase E1 component [Longimicrobiaceae bacterium]|nr:2-oxoglutarate dehydrogenase E1 component [Longimicrobiaceae bacterium]